LPEWLTGSPAICSCQRLCFARECSNRSGDAFLFLLSTVQQLNRHWTNRLTMKVPTAEFTKFPHAHFFQPRTAYCACYMYYPIHLWETKIQENTDTLFMLLLLLLSTFVLCFSTEPLDAEPRMRSTQNRNEKCRQ
jgi:hypothetical protein